MNNSDKLRGNALTFMLLLGWVVGSLIRLTNKKYLIVVGTLWKCWGGFHNIHNINQTTYIGACFEYSCGSSNTTLSYFLLRFFTCAPLPVCLCPALKPFVGFVTWTFIIISRWSLAIIVHFFFLSSFFTHSLSLLHSRSRYLPSTRDHKCLESHWA